jgi:DNA-binding NtrC family response regulator
MVDEKIRILVVDDDETFLDDLTRLLQREYVVEQAKDPRSALEVLTRSTFDAVLLDLDLGRGTDGFLVLEKVRAREPSLPVIVVTKETSAASAVTALKKGANDYIDKTPDLSALERRISRALAEQRGRLVAENRLLRREIHALKGRMIGDSPPMLRLWELIRGAAGSRRSTLVVGETGTGKELVARALHELACPQGPFVAINCAAVPRELFPAELFGSERGAYTGAERRIPGACEVAAGGLLFLDEITEMDAALQAALLRLIEQQEFRPLGGAKTQEFTGRVVASTNRNLEETIAGGRLRQDLYYRFSANVIAVPPLRERREDIPALAEYFLDRAAIELKRPRRQLTPAALVWLCAHNWPGNVRELENMIEVFVVSGRLNPLSAPVPSGGAAAQPDIWDLPYHQAKELAVRRFQEQYVRAILAAHDGNVTAAAHHMGLSRFGLEKMLRQLAPPEA